MMDPVDWLLRATSLLGLAALIIWAFRAHAASTRHLLWTTTFLLLVTLPVAIYFLPEVEWVVWPFSGARTPDLGLALGPALTPQGLSFTFHSMLPVLWMIGSLALLVSLILGGVRFASLVRKGHPIDDPEWTDTVEGLRDRLDIRRPVRLILSSEIDIPMTGGVLRPVILLPEAVTAWTPSCRMAVLSHELIHISRHDALRQWLSGVALALYWFHPLSWWAARRAILSREQACDEGVLELGARPSDYAAHLLTLASSPKAPRALLSLPLVQSSQLERRILAILSPRRPGSSWTMASLLCFVLVLCGMTTAILIPPQAPSCDYSNPLPENLVSEASISE